MDRWTQADGQRDRLADRKTDWKTDRQTERQTDSKTKRKKEWNISGVSDQSIRKCWIQRPHQACVNTASSSPKAHIELKTNWPGIGLEVAQHWRSPKAAIRHLFSSSSLSCALSVILQQFFPVLSVLSLMYQLMGKEKELLLGSTWFNSAIKTFCRGYFNDHL